MTVDDSTKDLASLPLPIQIETLKRIKNSAIGHQESKHDIASDAELIRSIISILDHGSDNARLQAAYILASLAKGSTETVEILTSYPIIPIIIHLQQTPVSFELTTASLRILVSLFSHKPDRSLLLNHPEMLRILQTLIESNDTPVALLDLTCQLVGCLLSSFSDQAVYQAPNNFDPQTQLCALTGPLAQRIVCLFYQWDEHPSKGTILACLDSALYAFTRVISPSQARQLLTDGHITFYLNGAQYSLANDEFLSRIMSLTRSSQIGLRLTAVALLTKFRNYASSTKQQEELTKLIIPVLIPVLHQFPNDIKAARTLASICVADERSAAIVVEVGFVKEIASLLEKEVVKKTPEANDLTQNYLLALSGIGLHRDQFRSEIIDSGAFKIVTQLLAGSEEVTSSRKVKIAACHVLRALSRSVKLLRTSLGAVDIAGGFKELLMSGGEDEHNLEGANTDMEMVGDESDVSSKIKLKSKAATLSAKWEVQTAVMAAVCNLILEFSPLHKSIMDKGFLDIIVDCAHSPYEPLRLNSLWALKNVIYEAAQTAKLMVLEKITCSYLLELCYDRELEIQEQALDFLRNVLCRNSPAVDNILAEFGPNVLFDMVRSKMDISAEIYPRVVVSAIYVLVHIAAGTDAHRDLIISRDELLTRLLPLMTSSNVEIRTACVWLVINLTHAGDHGNFPVNEACKHRAQKLVDFGFKEMLSERNLEGTLDIRERVRTALFQLQGYSTPARS